MSDEIGQAQEQAIETVVLGVTEMWERARSMPRKVLLGPDAAKAIGLRAPACVLHFSPSTDTREEGWVRRMVVHALHEAQGFMGEVKTIGGFSFNPERHCAVCRKLAAMRQRRT